MASSDGLAPAAFSFKGSMDKYAALEGLKRESPAAERNKQPIADVLLEYLASHGAAKAAAAAAATGAPRRPPLLLEIASGSGQHVAHLASQLPAFLLQPSDVTPELFGSVAAYAAAAPNVRLPPLLLDASAPDWPEAAAAAVAAAAAAAEAATGASSGGLGGGGGGVRDGGDGGSSGNGVSGGGGGVAAGGLDADAILCVNMCHISPLAATRGLLRGAGRALRPGGGLLFVYGPFTRDRRHTSDSNAAFDASLRARDPEWGYRDVGDMAGWAAEAGLECLEVRGMPANNFLLVFRRP